MGNPPVFVRWSFRKTAIALVFSLWFIPILLRGKPGEERQIEPGTSAGRKMGPVRDASITYLRAGSRLTDYRLPYTFLFPLATEVRIVPDAGFFSMRARSVHGESFLIRLTAFRIRDENKLVDLSRRIPFPCQMDSLPARGDFRIEKECEGKVNGNSLVRWIVLEREGDILRFLYLAVRRREQTTGRAIRAGIEKNPAFYHNNSR